MTEKRLTPDELVAYFAGYLDGQEGIVLSDKALQTFRDVANQLYRVGMLAGADMEQEVAIRPIQPIRDDVVLCPCPECNDEEFDWWEDEDEDWDEDDEWEDCDCCVGRF